MYNELVIKSLFDLDIKNTMDGIERAKKALSVFKAYDGKRIDKRLADAIHEKTGLRLTKDKNWHNENEWTLTFYPDIRHVCGEPDRNGIKQAYYIKWSDLTFFWSLVADVVDYPKIEELILKKIKYEQKGIDDLKKAWRGREQMKKERARLVELSKAFNEKWQSVRASEYLDIPRDYLYR